MLGRRRAPIGRLLQVIHVLVSAPSDQSPVSKPLVREEISPLEVGEPLLVNAASQVSLHAVEACKHRNLLDLIGECLTDLFVVNLRRFVCPILQGG